MRIITVTKKDSYFNQFRTTLHQISPLSEVSWNAMKAKLQITSFEKNKVILEAGLMPKNLYFICEGIVVIYFVDDKGKTYVKNILFENEFPAATSALIMEKPSHLTLKCLQESILISVAYKDFKVLTQQHSELKDLYLRYLELNWVVQKEITELSLALDSAEQRYRNLLAKYPRIERRIPQHYLASHLGITPTQLSRIRKKLK